MTSTKRNSLQVRISFYVISFPHVFEAKNKQTPQCTQTRILPKHSTVLIAICNFIILLAVELFLTILINDK